MATIDDVKKELRISGTAADTEIQMLIDAVKLELAESGVLTVSETDALVKMAIMLYCKGHFGYDNPEAERFLEKYELLRGWLGTASAYNSHKVTFSVTAGGIAFRDAAISIDDEDGTVLVTNSQGQAFYYVYSNGDVDYTISATGYTTIDTSAYISADTTVTVVMV